jgi:hypothetical protein
MKFVKICPKCGSLNISCGNLGRQPILICSDCGFEIIGNFPEIEETKIEEFRKHLKRK